MTVTDELIEMRGLRFHYRDWTSTRPGAPSLVLLHGFTGHARTWDAFAEAMSDRYRVLALDQRGHGESAWASADAYGVDDMRQDMAAFVSALGLDRFTLLGLSMGGNVAIHFAGGRPAKLAALVIVDIAPEVEAAGAGRIQASVRTSDLFDSKDAAFAAARAANPTPPEAHHRHRIEQNLMLTEEGRWTWRYDRALRAPGAVRVRDPDAGWRAVANIEVPTLLVRGERSDLVSPAVAERMLGANANIRMTTVKDAGHSVPLDQPEAFASACREFLQGG